MDAPVVAIPPPTDLYNQRTLLYTSCILTGLSTIIIALRMYTRITILHKIAWTDWAMLFAWTWIVGYLAEILVGYYHGMGLHIIHLSPSDMIVFMKVTLAIQVGYYLIVAAIKASILLFYLQLGGQPLFHKLCSSTLWLIVGVHAIFIVVTLAQCVPTHKLWDFTGAVSGRCIDSTAFFYTTSTFNIVTDFWIIGLPIKTLLGIQRATREKFVLIGIFAVGIFACIASIVRLYSIRVYTQSEDPFFDAVPVNTWSMIEVNVALICASIPSIKPLVSSKVRNRFKQESHGLSKTGRTNDTYGSSQRHRIGSVQLKGSELTDESTTELNGSEDYKEAQFSVSSVGGTRQEVV